MVDRVREELKASWGVTGGRIMKRYDGCDVTRYGGLAALAARPESRIYSRI